MESFKTCNYDELGGQKRVELTLRHTSK